MGDQVNQVQNMILNRPLISIKTYFIPAFGIQHKYPRLLNNASKKH